MRINPAARHSETKYGFVILTGDMIFEDFFWLTFAIGLKRGQRAKESKDRTIRIDKTVKEHISSVLPFKLTNAQRKATVQIFNDLKSPAPMNRLLQGDVVCGKTIVALV